MVSVLLLFAFVMSLVINYFERIIYNYNTRNEGVSREERAEAGVANNPE